MVSAIGFSPDWERVLRYASQAVRGNLTLVHVIPASVSDRPVQLDLEEHLEPAKRDAASRRLAELQGTAGSHAPVRILIGAIKDMWTEEARRLRADVLVMGGVRNPARSVASGILPMQSFATLLARC